MQYGYQEANYGYGNAVAAPGNADAPKPLDQLPRLARDTTAENPWPVSVVSHSGRSARV